MAQLVLNVGTNANDGTGDTLRDAMIKVNTNFTEVYGSAGFDLTTIQVTGNEIRATRTNDDIVFENDYGQSRNQIEMLSGDNLHEQGYQGQGIHIAVLDAGFRKTDEIDAFTHLFANNVGLCWPTLETLYIMIF